MAKARLTIEFEYGPQRVDYAEPYDSEGKEIELTEEQINALTTAEMLEYDRRFMEHGDFDLMDFLASVPGDWEKGLKLEVLEESNLEDVEKMNAEGFE